MTKVDEARLMQNIVETVDLICCAQKEARERRA